MTRPLSFTPSWETSCAGKRGYPKPAAKRALKVLRSHGRDDHRLEVYRCPYCDW